MRWKLSLIFALGLLALGAGAGRHLASAADSPVPRFTLDHDWPKPLPNHWQIGAAEGIFVDRHGLIWTTNQSNKLNDYDLALAKGQGDCCNMAPQIIAFDHAGNVVKSWNVSAGPGACAGYRCLDLVHTVYVDDKDNVWITGRGYSDSQILKFDYNGKFLLQIGGSEAKGCCGDQDTENVGGATAVAVWPATNEAFVTDGYKNRRIIVFDADTGKFKRMWGAYGHPPPPSTLTTETVDTQHGRLPAGVMYNPEPERKFEGEGPKEWSTVRAVSITPDGVVWIADRIGNRIQQFKIDGTYIGEAFVNRKSITAQGTVYDLAFSPDGKWIYIPDGGNKQLYIVDRKTLKLAGTMGNHCGGQMVGCFNHLDAARTYSEGNIYTGEAAAGARIQRWNIVK